MDIMNSLADLRYEEVDDLLAFVSIYDDKNRIKAYKKMLEKNSEKISGKVCVEAGCGFGLFAEFMALLGAKKVYAVEKNPLLFNQAQQRLAPYPNVELVNMDIKDFKPAEQIDVLVHELFGQLLYDEDLFVLQELAFQPKFFLPNKAVLAYGCTQSQQLIDDTVTTNVLNQLDGCLVSGLFDESDQKLETPVITWGPADFIYSAQCDISKLDGDLLFFGLQIFQNDELICTAGECDNWSFVWTPRQGDHFDLEFKKTDRGMDAVFLWMKEKTIF
jgi:SAM-dependent methyltransferase